MNREARMELEKRYGAVFIPSRATKPINKDAFSACFDQIRTKSRVYIYM